MNFFLVALGLLIFIVPTVLAIVALVIVVRGQNRVREELRVLRADLDQTTRNPRASA